MKHIPFLIAALLLAPALRAQDQAKAPVKIESAWVRAVPPGADATAAYMKITNTGEAAIRLTGGESPIAPMVHAMVTTEKTVDGKAVKGMELVDSLEIPPGGTRVLQPGGDHIMLMEMKKQPAEGTITKLTLHFQPGDHKINLDLPVSRIAPK